MTARPVLPRTFIASAAADGWNRLAAAAGRRLPFGARGASAVFEEAPPPGPDLPRAGFEIGGARVQVVIAAFPFAALFGTELQASDLPALPRPLADALVDGIANLVRGALPDGAPPFARTGRPGSRWCSTGSRRSRSASSSGRPARPSPRSPSAGCRGRPTRPAAPVRSPVST